MTEEFDKKILKDLKIEKSVGKSTLPDRMILVKRDNIIHTLNFKCKEAISLTKKEVLNIIEERIKYYSTTYGLEYKTPIQEAFIQELKKLKKQIERKE